MQILAQSLTLDSRSWYMSTYTVNCQQQERENYTPPELRDIKYVF